MSVELAVLAIHGIGSQDDDKFADEMREELIARVSGLGKDPEKIAWKPIYWADILEERQLRYLHKARRSGDLDFIGLRKFVVTALGDASAYQKVESEYNTTYEEIHCRVEETIKTVYESDLDSTPKPMIILAHSLGGHIISNYIWDMQHSDDPPPNAFEGMEYLVGLVTFGCNIPLFTFAYEDVVPIKFPPESLPSDLKDKAKWLNFYDPDDVLGYPLRPINDAYKDVVDEDIPINVGGIFTSWNPMSHMHYWIDNDLTKPVSEFVASFL